MYIKTLSVSDLNKYVKNIIDNDFILNNSSVKGEISNLKIHSSGHIYFSLKDSYSKINCVMFRSNARNLKFIPEEGMNVVIEGYISVYEKGGVYQLYCKSMKPQGVGDLYIAFEKLKNKLEEEGLFREEHKVNIPSFPKKIGVVTSITGAALRDIINVTKRRNKNINLLIYPALVQGEKSSSTIIDGIEKLNKISDVDLIIIARGGGSIEELWSFNDEKLAYSIYKSKKPIISGVGHETDFTIADFVSDRRAPTPSAAAEIAVFNSKEWERQVYNYKNKLFVSMKNNIGYKKTDIDSLKNKLELNSPMNVIVNQYNHIEKLKDGLNMKMKSSIDRNKDKILRYSSLLEAYNPFKVLNKGYSIIEDDKENLITSKEELKKKEHIKVTLKDGSLKIKINEVKE